MILYPKDFYIFTRKKEVENVKAILLLISVCLLFFSLSLTGLKKMSITAAKEKA
jgi:hypothetical protein